MLGENIRIFRKQKGYSQEMLAHEMKVVRQTVSKWEKGYSVPDAEMLNALSELFEVPVSTLLGSTISEEEGTSDGKIEEVAKQLAILNEQLANNASKKRKTIKKVLTGVLIAVILFILAWAACYYYFRVLPRQNAVYSRSCIECTLNGETYGYEFIYDEDFQIYESGGDAWIANHILVENYDDYNVAIAQIEDYITDHGGTYKITELDEWTNKL